MAEVLKGDAVQVSAKMLKRKLNQQAINRNQRCAPLKLCFWSFKWIELRVLRKIKMLKHISVRRVNRTSLYFRNGVHQSSEIT